MEKRYTAYIFEKVYKDEVWHLYEKELYVFGCEDDLQILGIMIQEDCEGYLFDNLQDKVLYWLLDNRIYFSEVSRGRCLETE